MRLSLNIYAMAHASGIFNPEGLTPHFQKAEDFLPMVHKVGFSSLELPLDYFFDSLDDIKFQNFIAAAQKDKIDIFPALENFDPKFLKTNLHHFQDIGWNTIRIKMPHLGETFYGGNRHLSYHFLNSLSSFSAALDDIDNDLGNAGVKVAIENHQDLDAHDLVMLCQKSSHGSRSITWDVGNSLSTQHTPKEFVEIAGNYISNIHFKDYHVISHPEGIALRRAVLGEGFIDLLQVSQDIKTLPQCQNVSMELAAHPDRICRIHNADYHQPEEMSDQSKLSFHRYIQTVMTEQPDQPSLSGEMLTKLELDQTLTSCHQLKRLFV